ncbi:MAG: hypothetical protein JWM65_3253 [Sphingomonas bacterium]|nr:hypothetical protein [Sphingomonas bacterium]
MVQPHTPIEHRVALIVGGNFTADALGPRYEATLRAVAQAPADHLAAFDRLYLSATADPGRFADLHLPRFLQIVAPLLPGPTAQAAATLGRRFNSVAQHQEAEMAEAAEAAEAATAQDVARRRRRLIARRNELNALLRPG